MKGSCKLGPSWGHVGALLKSHWGFLGAISGAVGPFWGSWKGMGGRLGASWASWLKKNGSQFPSERLTTNVALGLSWAALGALSGAHVTVLGPCWAPLGDLLGRRGDTLRHQEQSRSEQKQMSMAKNQTICSCEYRNCEYRIRCSSLFWGHEHREGWAEVGVGDACGRQSIHPPPPPPNRSLSTFLPRVAIEIRVALQPRWRDGPNTDR